MTFPPPLSKKEKEKRINSKKLKVSTVDGQMQNSEGPPPPKQKRDLTNESFMFRDCRLFQHSILRQRERKEIKKKKTSQAGNPNTVNSEFIIHILCNIRMYHRHVGWVSWIPHYAF